MLSFAAVMGIIVGLSLTVTKVVDFVRNLPWFKDKWVGGWEWNLLAFAVGIAFCWGWQHSFVSDLFSQVPSLSTLDLSGTWGYILSGMLLGGLSGFGHELLDALSSVANRNNAAASQ